MRSASRRANALESDGLRLDALECAGLTADVLVSAGLARPVRTPGRTVMEEYLLAKGALSHFPGTVNKVWQTP
jgi:hypothetical protein